MKKLFLLCGIPGSGKTTFVRKWIKKNPNKNIEHISRDEVRFSLISDSDEYFAKEKEVFTEFIRLIHNALLVNDEVFVDATHLNESSRNKVLDKLNLRNIDIYCVSFEVPLITCLERNAQRSGRSLVPVEVIEKMYTSYRIPTFDEKYGYKKIFHICK